MTLMKITVLISFYIRKLPFDYECEAMKVRYLVSFYSGVDTNTIAIIVDVEKETSGN